MLWLPRIRLKVSSAVTHSEGTGGRASLSKMDCAEAGPDEGLGRTVVFADVAGDVST